MKEIDGYTRTCGLIGNPVEHTLSPLIHNTLSEMLDKKLCYVPLKVGKGLLEDAVKGAYALNLLGMNITVPYKSEVIPFLKEIDPLAEKIGAVNTLVRVEDGYKGYNTDMPGLYRGMCEDGVRIQGEKVVILGAGGVARAVAVLLEEKGAECVFILNRTLEKAWAIADEVNAIAGRNFAKAMCYRDYSGIPGDGKFLAIQATSVGMHPHEEETVLEEDDFYKRVHTGYDLIFNPEHTKFMRKVEAAGGQAYNGSKMLLYQGIIAYELWTGCSVSDKQAEEVFAAMKRSMR